MPFLNDLIVTKKRNGDGPHLAGEGEWCLYAPLEYDCVRLADRIVIPAGFCCDMASVPRIPIVWEYCGACAHRAAVIHDWGCKTCNETILPGFYFVRRGEKLGTVDVTRAQVDAIFRDAMKETGIGPIRRWLMWGAVRLHGIFKGLMNGKQTR
jgi:hypothetical protein